MEGLGHWKKLKPGNTPLLIEEGWLRGRSPKQTGWSEMVGPPRPLPIIRMPSAVFSEVASSPPLRGGEYWRDFKSDKRLSRRIHGRLNRNIVGAHRAPLQ